eukprot:jgi/Astpho2/2935/fgenesh1_pg.00050_%23_170_t
MAALLLLALAAVQGARAQLNQAAYLPLQSDGDTPVAPGNSFYGTTWMSPGVDSSQETCQDYVSAMPNPSPPVAGMALLSSAAFNSSAVCGQCITWEADNQTAAAQVAATGIQPVPYGVNVTALVIGVAGQQLDGSAIGPGDLLATSTATYALTAGWSFVTCPTQATGGVAATFSDTTGTANTIAAVQQSAPITAATTPADVPATTTAAATPDTSSAAATPLTYYGAGADSGSYCKGNAGLQIFGTDTIAVCTALLPANCGAQACVMGTGSGLGGTPPSTSPVTYTINNACPECCGYNGVDVASSGDGRWDINWHLGSCGKKRLLRRNRRSLLEEWVYEAPAGTKVFTGGFRFGSGQLALNANMTAPRR